MKAKPMVLVKDCVLNVMAGRQTMDRRIINDSCLQSINFDEISPIMNTPPHQHDDGKWYYELQSKVDDTEHFEIKPKYQVGDKVYVAEGYQVITDIEPNRISGLYLADGVEFNAHLTRREWGLFSKRKFKYRPTPGRFMYKSLARTFRKITGVGVERVRDISLEDIIAEGISPKNRTEPTMYICWYNRCDSIHGKDAAADNKWVLWYKFDKE